MMVAVGRILQAVDFERVLKARNAARSPHFAVHHVSGHPTRFNAALSTASAPVQRVPVDDIPSAGIWLGFVVPKRHAKRSVTRSLLKRQINAAVLASVGLESGLWVVRLRSGFDRRIFPSAASAALAAAARTELQGLMLQVLRQGRAATAAV